VAAPLYLDTARLGLMSPAARRAASDFTRLAGREGGSVVFERLLQHGTARAMPGGPAAYPGLAGWGGVEDLRSRLRGLAGGSTDLPVLMANRSAQLMKLAARLLVRTCRNILVTDLGWPPYHDLLARECRRAGRVITSVAVRQAILEARITEDELVDFVCAEYARCHCEGLFLTAVSNDGIRLPVERIVRRLEASRKVWFVALDGAQDFCHVTADLRNEYCDLYLASAQKWLGAYQPLGLGFYGRRRSRGLIETQLGDMFRDGDLDDPLLRYLLQLDADTLDGWSETVNLTPLVACCGASADAARTDRSVRYGNRERAVEAAEGTGWLPVLPAPAFRGGILLLRAERPRARRADPRAVRAAFHDRGVVLTAYENGFARLSMPNAVWRPDELETLRSALQATA